MGKEASASLLQSFGRHPAQAHPEPGPGCVHPLEVGDCLGLCHMPTPDICHTASGATMPGFGVEVLRMVWLRQQTGEVRNLFARSGIEFADRRALVAEGAVVELAFDAGRACRTNREPGFAVVGNPFKRNELR